MILVQDFQSQLTQQLEILHKAVASSTTQQEKQLKAMEEDMNSFVSTNTDATAELRARLEKLKAMYCSGIKALDDLAREVNSNSQSTFGQMNSKGCKHSSTLEEAHCRAVESTRSISEITVNFFNTLDGHASKMGQIVHEAQVLNDQKLSELEQKFKECAAAEERQLLAKIADLLADSNKMNQTVKRMTKLIEDDVDSFAKKLELYFKKRPELLSLIEEFLRCWIRTILDSPII